MKLDSIKLRKFREKNKLSQAELATQLDLSQTTICDWEKEDYDVKLEHILKMCNVFQCDISELTKDGTTINIQHNNKVSSNSIIGIEVNVESYQLQKDLIENLKEHNFLLKEENKRLKEQLNP